MLKLHVYQVFHKIKGLLEVYTLLLVPNVENEN